MEVSLSFRARQEEERRKRRREENSRAVRKKSCSLLEGCWRMLCLSFSSLIRQRATALSRTGTQRQANEEKVEFLNATTSCRKKWTNDWLPILESHACYWEPISWSSFLLSAAFTSFPFLSSPARFILLFPSFTVGAGDRKEIISCLLHRPLEKGTILRSRVCGRRMQEM